MCRHAGSRLVRSCETCCAYGVGGEKKGGKRERKQDPQPGPLLSAESSPKDQRPEDAPPLQSISMPVRSLGQRSRREGERKEKRKGKGTSRPRQNAIALLTLFICRGGTNLTSSLTSRAAIRQIAHWTIPCREEEKRRGERGGKKKRKKKKRGSSPRS